MKAIMVMFDSLNRHMLPPYGCDWMHAPNFAPAGGAHASPSTTPTSAACPACPRGASCTPAATTSCTAAGGRWSRSTTPCRRCSSEQRRLHPPGQRPLPLLGRRRLHLPHALQHLGDLPRPGGRPLEGPGARPGDPADASTAAAGRCWRQDWVNRALHARARRISPRPQTFADGLEFIRTQPRAGQLVPAHRDLRPARAVLHPPEVQGPLPARLRRPALRLAAVRAASTRRREQVRALPLRVRGAAQHVRRTTWARSWT